MRTAVLPMLALAVALGASAARAENIGIDVAVDVAGLDPAVQSGSVNCMVCTGDDCDTDAQAHLTLGVGVGTFTPVAHAFQGTVTVNVPTSSDNATAYLCRLKLADASSAYVAGTGPDWTLPDPASPFTNMLKGKLPASTDQTCTDGQQLNDAGVCEDVPAASSCPQGTMKINGQCINPCGAGQEIGAAGTCVAKAGSCASGTLLFKGVCINPCPAGTALNASSVCEATAATTPKAKAIKKIASTCGQGTTRVGDSCVAACPDGTPVPASGNCAGAPTINLNGLFGLLPCPGKGVKQADGSCAAAPSPTVSQALTCSDGQLRMKDGQCPQAQTTSTFKSKQFLFLKSQPSTNDTLR